MSDGSGLAVTVARYETPDHIDINKVLYLSTSLHSQRLLISLVNLVFERPGIFDPFAYMNESVWNMYYRKRPKRSDFENIRQTRACGSTRPQSFNLH